MARYGDLIRKAKAGATDNAELETTKLESSQAETIIHETRKPDSYTKVAMRLSAEAVDKLKRWRLETGLPYEILVDVLIRSQEHPTPAQLAQAKRIRQQRLLEGRQKAVDSLQKKMDN